MAVIGINYHGFTHEYNEQDERIDLDPSDSRYLKYESVYISYDDGEKVFDSGNFIKDWFDAKKFYIQELQDSDPFLSGSSSCNHFHMDGADFDSAYLHVEGEEPVLKYVDHTDEDWMINQRDIVKKGWEFFVQPGTQPTWKELKELCQ